MGNINPGEGVLMADKRSSFESVIASAIDGALKDLHTCLPAVVTSVSHANQLIGAQITIKRKLAGKLVLLPPLVGVPLRYPKSNTFSITFPIEVGDHVLIFFCERSIDVWLQNGGIVNPFDVRKFSLSDAFAIPFMYPQTSVIPNFNTSNLEIKTNSGDTKIIVKGSEDVEITTTGDVDATCDTASISATTSVAITSPITTVTGNLSVTGTISAPTINASTSLTVKSKEMDDHKHSQGIDSDGDTQQNTDGPV